MPYSFKGFELHLALYNPQEFTPQKMFNQHRVSQDDAGGKAAVDCLELA